MALRCSTRASGFRASAVRELLKLAATPDAALQHPAPQVRERIELIRRLTAHRSGPFRYEGQFDHVLDGALRPYRAAG